MLPAIAALELTSAFTITPSLMLVAPALLIVTSPVMLTAAPWSELLPTRILPSATAILSADKSPAVMLAAPTEVQLKAPLPSVFNTCPSSPSPSGKVKVTSAVTVAGAFKAIVLDPSASFSLMLLAFPTVTSPVAVMAAPLILPVVITA